MSKENDLSDQPWGDEDEEESPLDTTPQNRPSARSSALPPQTTSRPSMRLRPRGVPGAGQIYEEHDESLTQRSRTTRQAHDEALARVRQRSRRPWSEQEQGTMPRSSSASKSRRLSSRREEMDEYPSQGSRVRRGEREEFSSQGVRGRRDEMDEHPSQGVRGRREEIANYPTQIMRMRREDMDDYAYPQEIPLNMPREPVASAHSHARARDYEAYDEYDAVRYQRGQSSRRPQSHRPARRRRAGSGFLTSCLAVLLTLVILIVAGLYYVLRNTPLVQNLGKAAYTQQISQTLTLGNVGAVIVKNQIGNISINVGGNESSASLTSVRKVQATSQSDADNQFDKIIVSTQQVSQGTDPACTVSTCFLIAATLPPDPNANSGGLFGASNTSSVDLVLTLPTSFNSPDPAKPSILSASTTAGDLAVSGFNGMLNLTGNSGKITVAHTLIFAGTCLQTMQGDITVGQGSIFDLSQPSDQIPCSATASSGVHPWFNITSGRGNVDITLTTPSTNVLLDANTNNGKISDDFGLNIPSTSDGSASYHGPLLPNGTPNASLYVFTSTGNINVHQH